MLELRREKLLFVERAGPKTECATLFGSLYCVLLLMVYI